MLDYFVQLINGITCSRAGSTALQHKCHHEYDDSAMKKLNEFIHRTHTLFWEKFYVHVVHV